MKKEIFIISLGGSLVAPDGIDINFLKSFRNLILRYIQGKRFIICVGGGKTARNYQIAMAELGLKPREVDWMGIEATRLNAYLIKNLFGNFSYSKIIKNPTKKIELKKDILVAAGWKPGWSTDFDSVSLAKNFGKREIINLTNVDYIYDKNPKKFPNVKPLKKISWSKLIKIVGEKWKPGLSVPFDPIAAKFAKKFKMKVIFINGKKIERLENFLNKKSFLGTIVS